MMPLGQDESGIDRIGRSIMKSAAPLLKALGANLKHSRLGHAGIVNIPTTQVGFEASTPPGSPLQF